MNKYLIATVVAVLLLIIGLAGCATNESVITPQKDSILYSEPTQAPITYCRAVVADKCKSIDGEKDSRIYLKDGVSSGRWVDVDSSCAGCYGSLYSQASIGKEYIVKLQGEKVVGLYTLTQASETCELRSYVNETGCGV